ncbi:hypothetical protein SAMN04487868_10111 [Marinobacter salarius]|jgi:TPR repeat protein|uniref:Beta-lactamase n=1 Tax=Marinobacter salarius TaxID=1420917 RepID=A0ABY1FGY1_9GAMM|nr:MULTISPECIES: tetratricopeptide repeat protein [Marinobacter]MBL84890.1 sel1 repeat family protein [Marinobacter sp.]MBS8232904.1 sel1 repeat family protein [Marinobacter salarius]SFL36367.1 hypothetical protein SAMN04487868_10111 [Marinobacter salarius]|tara:strand:+ start:522 stop:2249 length:1728 start_codon:yes stop_codon:yes gene_type:complete
MSIDLSTFNFSEISNYWAYALGIAVSFYGTVSWFSSKHLSKESKEHLSLWLWGSYESTWLRQFCLLFDAVFGRRHLSWACFLRSSVASFITVFILYFLLGDILQEKGRIGVYLDTKDLIIYSLILNVISDYLSLFETRWLLNKFSSISSIWNQLALLAFDALITAGIIWFAIEAYLFVLGKPAPSLVELVAVFSIFSIFFYSTFLTSIWAWLYCLSSWCVRLISKTRLNELLDIEHNPGHQIALIGGIAIFLIIAILFPFFKDSELSNTSLFDRYLCDTFPKATCDDLARLSTNEKQTLFFLEKNCDGGGLENCIIAASDYYLDDDGKKAADLYQKACEFGHPDGCKWAGWLYMTGFGVDSDYVRAIKFYDVACKADDLEACVNIGFMFENGAGVDQSYSAARDIYHLACERGALQGCNNLGYFYQEGKGVEKDIRKAKSLYEKSCNDEAVWGCNNLGGLYYKGLGVERDIQKMLHYNKMACDRDLTIGCDALGAIYLHGRGVPIDYQRALEYFQKSCSNNSMLGCSFLATMHASGQGVTKNLKKGLKLLTRACEHGSNLGCNLLKVHLANQKAQ